VKPAEERPPGHRPDLAPRGLVASLVSGVQLVEPRVEVAAPARADDHPGDVARQPHEVVVADRYDDRILKPVRGHRGPPAAPAGRF
jgi:hypothetical protein